MATEGVDLPETGCIILARPTLSLTMYLQMVGRGTRISADGEALIIIDCSGNTDRFGTLSSPRHWSLNPEIDPNNLRSKMKVVGKKPDGTYTEDLEEFVGEVVEMDPEEYMKHLAGGLDSAKKVNLTIEEKMEDVMVAMYKVLAKVVKDELDKCIFVPMLKLRNDECKLMFISTIHEAKYEKIIEESEGGEINTYKLSDCARVVVDIKGKCIFASMNVPDSMSYYAERTPDYMKMTLVAGKINEAFLKHEKVTLKLRELHGQIEDLEKTKINISAIEETAKQFKQEQHEKVVRNHATLVGEFDFTRPLTLKDYFKDPDDYSSRKQIFGIILPNKSILGHQNKIILKVKIPLDAWDRRNNVTEKPIKLEEKNYIKGDKILELINFGKWEPTAEEEAAA